MKTPKFLLCERCKNLVGVIDDAGVPIWCCNHEMKELVPNTTDAAGEKHLPVVTVEGDMVKVSVGSVEHPMQAEHYIEWVYLLTNKSGHRKVLSPDDKPELIFNTSGDKPVAVYAYCNLHGLWKTDI